MSIVFGAGGGKKNASSSADDTLKSNAYALIVDAISEGPIVGLVDGANSIYINKTPLSNIEESSFQFRTGNPDDEPVNGIAGSEAYQNVGVSVSQVIGPQIRTVIDTDTDLVRIYMNLGNLYKVNNKGALKTTDSGWNIDVRPAGGDWTRALTFELNNEKCTSPVQFQHDLRLEAYGDGPWDIRLTARYPDRTDDKIYEFITWEGYSLVTEAKFTYPHTAHAALRLAAEHVGSSVQNRHYHIFARKILIPSNYNPRTRTYTGIWDGTFKVDWSNNPAWIFYDIVRNGRFGIGNEVPASVANKWQLYTIAQYCDQLVPSGYKDANGNDVMEPRYSFNGVITDKKQALDALRAMTAVWRGMGFYTQSQFFVTADMVQDVAHIYGPANVVDGRFEYSNSSAKSRHSVVQVRFNDANNFFEPAIEPVIDNEMVHKFGWLEKTVELTGCSSRSLARRYGKWIIDSEKNEVETVTFSVGMDSIHALPGEVIAINDPRRAEVRTSGRIASVSGGNAITMDQVLDPSVNKTGATLYIHKPDGTIFKRTVNVQANGRVMTIGAGNATDDLVGCVFVLSAVNVVPREYRIISIDEDSSGATYKITALQYDRHKFARIEQGIVFDPLPVRVDRSKVNTVRNLQATAQSYTDGGGVRTDISLNWTPPEDTLVREYEVTVDTPTSRGVRVGTTSLNSISYSTYEPGQYVFRVRTVNIVGNKSLPANLTHLVNGSTDISIGQVTDLVNAVTGQAGGQFTGPDVSIRWKNMMSVSTDPTVPLVEEDPALYAGSTVRVYSGATLLREQNVIGNSYTYSLEMNRADASARGLPSARRSLRFEVSLTDKEGRVSLPSAITLSNPAPAAPILRASSSGPIINLDWDPVNDRDLEGYLVWISTNANFVPAQTTPTRRLKADQMTWTGTPAEEYFVVVAAYDAFGEDTLNYSSKFSVSTGIDPFDDVAPAVPTGLQLSSTVDSLTATWNPNTESDLSRYDIEITEGTGNPVSFVTTTPSYVWRGTQPNTSFSVRIRAVDRTGNRSNWTNPVNHTTARDTTPPPKTGDITARPGIRQALLSWPASTATDLARYEIYQSTSTTNPNASTTPTYTSAATTLAAGNLDDGATYHFWVRAVDTSENKGAWSNRATVTTTFVSQLIQDQINSATWATELGFIRPHDGDELPTTNIGATISWQNKLYTWDGTKYVPSASFEDLTFEDIPGTISPDQIPSSAISADKIAEDLQQLIEEQGQSAAADKQAAEAARDAAEAARNAAQTAQNQSQTAQQAAELARTAASGSATSAEAAKTAAETARDQAQTAHTQSQTARTAAEAAKGAAETARDQAQNAAQNADGSATAAAGSASTATTKATEAGNSATAAAASVVAAESARDEAAGSATASASSASSAATKAGEAATSASAAQTARTQAQTARTQAQEARDAAVSAQEDAEGAAATATTQAGIATQAANSAGDSAAAASQSAATATTRAGEASTSASAAQTARTGAETARGQAQTAATNAATSETNAAGSASAAASSASVSASTYSNTLSALAGASATPTLFVNRDQWTGSGPGAPGTAPAPAPYFQQVNGAPAFVRTLTSGSALVYSDPTVPAGEVAYRVTVRYRLIDPTEAVVRLVIASLNQDFTVRNWLYAGPQIPTSTTTPDIQTSVFVVSSFAHPGATTHEAIAAGHSLRIGIQGACTGPTTFELYSLLIEDVTAELKAEKSATAAASSASSASASETAAGQSASAAQSAQTQAETARTQAQTARNEAVSARQTAEEAAATATTQAGIATTARNNAEQSASAAAGSASTASTKASEAGTSATAANASRVAAETARGQAQTAASNAASSETNAAGSANSAATSAGVAATAYSGTLSAIMGSSRVPTAFNDPKLWSNQAAGFPEQLTDAPPSWFVELNGERVVQRSFTSATGLIYSKTLVPGGDKAYRLRLRYSVIDASAAQIGIAIAGLRADGTVANWMTPSTGLGPVHDGPTSAVQEITLLVSAFTAPEAWQNNGILNNPHLRVYPRSAAGSATVVFHSLEVEDVTQALKSLVSANAAASSASSASASETAAGQSATASQSAQTAAETARTQAQTARNEAVSAKNTAEEAAATATTQAGIATTARTNAQNSASAAAGSASTASTKATEASQAASAAAASATTASTKAGEASTSASQAATSETNAAGSANSAAQSASVAATAYGGALSAIMGASLVPNRFIDPNQWAAQYVGLGDVPSANPAWFQVVNGAPVLLRPVTPSTAGVAISKAVVPAGDVAYRMRLRFRVIDASNLVIGNCLAGLVADGTVSNWFVNADTESAVLNGTTDIIELSVIYSAFPAPGAVQASAIATRAHLRPYIRVRDGSGTVELHSLTVEDVTAELKALVSANAAASSASAADASATAAGQQASAAQTAKTQAETARSGAETARNEAVTARNTAEGAASTATTQAGIATSAKNDAQGSASAAAQSASNAASSATNAGQSATAAQTARTGAETARGQAQTSAANAATSETNAAGSASAAATSASVSATALSSVQTALNNARTILPYRPIPEALAFTASLIPGVPMAASAYGSDSDGPYVSRTTSNANHAIGLVGTAPATSGRVYRVTVRYKMNIAGTPGIYLQYLTPSGAGAGTSVLPLDGVTEPDVVREVTLTLGHTAGGLVERQTGNATNWATGNQVRFNLRPGVATAGTLTLYELRVEDVTEADMAARQATLAAGSASAAATSATNAAASQTAAGQSATAAQTARTGAETARGQAQTAATNAATSETNAAGSASTAQTQAGLAATARGQAEGFASAASSSASTATTKAGEAGTAASVASGHANTAQTQAGIATTKAGEAASSASSAAGSASEASSYAQLASLALSGGMSPNPTFQSWSASTPADVEFLYSTEGTITKRTDGKFGNAVQIQVTGTAAAGHGIRMANLRGASKISRILVSLDAEHLSGSRGGFVVSVGWVTSANTVWTNTLVGQKFAAQGGVQTYQFTVDMPAGLNQDDITDIRLQLRTSNNQGGGAFGTCNWIIHRFDAQTVLADSFVDEQRRTKATVDGLAESAYVMRVKAGGASAGFEMVAANNPSGPASSIRMSADEILLDGTVKAPKIGAGEITTSKLAVGDTTNMVPDPSFLDLDAWTFNNATATTVAGNANWKTDRLLNVLATTTWGQIHSKRFAVELLSELFCSVMARIVTGAATARLRIIFYAGINDTTPVGSAVQIASTTATSPSSLFGSVSVPADANYAEILLACTDAANSRAYFGLPIVRRKVSGELYVNGSITSTHLIQSEAVLTNSAQIKDAIITNAHITELSAAKLMAGTALASTLTVSGTALGTVRNWANDPAARINGASTQIDPGKIRISGSTTLSNWIKGGDETRIDGGMIAPNTIKANSAEFGMRNLTLTSIQFEHNRPSANSVWWSAGQIRWINDAGDTTWTGITSGSAAWTSGVLYIYWTKGASSLSTTTVQATAFAPDNAVLATYQGGKLLDADYGRTIIDGSDVKTGTLTADKANTTSFSNAGLALFGGTLQSTNFNAANGTGWRIQNNGTMNMPNAIIKGAHIGDLEVDTIKIKNNAVSTYKYALTTGDSNPGSSEPLQTFTITPGRSGPLVLDFQFEAGASAETGSFQLRRNSQLILSFALAGFESAIYFSWSWVDTSVVAGVAVTYTVHYVPPFGGNSVIFKNRFIGALDMLK